MRAARSSTKDKTPKSPINGRAGDSDDVKATDPCSNMTHISIRKTYTSMGGGGWGGDKNQHQDQKPKTFQSFINIHTKPKQ